MFFEELSVMAMKFLAQGINEEQRIYKAIDNANCKAVWRIGSLLPKYGGRGYIDGFKQKIVIDKNPHPIFWQEAEEKSQKILEEFQREIGPLLST